MLRSLESHLASAIDPAFPATIDIETGPWRPATGKTIVVHASRLELEALPVHDEPPGDDTAHEIAVVDFNTDGNEVDFVLAPEHLGEVMEVEAPVGFSLARGDGYFVDDRTVRCYRPPETASPGLRVILRGAAMQGFKRRRKVTISLEIAAYANGTTANENADEQLESALQIALAQMVDLPNLEAEQVAGVKVWLRAKSIRTWISSIERDVLEKPKLSYAKARLELRGEVDVVVGKGSPDPVGLIARIGGKITSSSANGASKPPETFDITGLPTPPALGPRSVGDRRLLYIGGLGRQTENDFKALPTPIETILDLSKADIQDIKDDLSRTSEIKAAELRQAARMVMAFPPLPRNLPEAALESSIDDLLDLDLLGLSARLGQGTAFAKKLRDELLTLKILLTNTALNSVKLEEFVPEPLG